MADSFFRQWVKHPDEASTLYWHSFLAEHPEQMIVVQQASELVRKLAEVTATLTVPVDTAEEAMIWNAVKERILTNEQARRFPFLNRYRPTNWNWLLAAASVLVVLGVGWWIKTGYQNETARQPRSITVAQAPAALIERKNTTDKSVLVTLPDGSSLLLRKGSRITYAREFGHQTRAVYLVGEAYFEVAKDPAHPFVVHANELLTKVLGTSFTVKAYPDANDVVVTVRTGRVAVFTQSDKKQQQKIESPTLEGIVLTPNQQLVFARREARLTRTNDVTLPTGLPTDLALTATAFVFNATPISQVFQELEKVYGITIVYDKNALGSCRLTTDLTDEPLVEKMNIICKTIEASYTMQTNQFVVSGTGCRP